MNISIYIEQSTDNADNHFVFLKENAPIYFLKNSIEINSC